MERPRLGGRKIVVSKALRWTSADLELFPQDGKRREIIDGDLYVSTLPHAYHQIACSTLNRELGVWNQRTGGGVVVEAPGLVFAEDDDVAPDIVWISRARFAEALDDAGHLRLAPELVVEVLSPGASNERRDREAKRKLYARRGVQEYWIVDWRARRFETYRLPELVLEHSATLTAGDVLESPILAGFACPIERVFADIPAA